MVAQVRIEWLRVAIVTKTKRINFLILCFTTGTATRVATIPPRNDPQKMRSEVWEDKKLLLAIL